MQTLLMHPPTGRRLLRFVGDRLAFSFRGGPGQPLPVDWRVLLRTNLGRARKLREEIVRAHFQKPPLAGASWRDIPMERQPDGQWRLELPLTETGYFRAKAYAVDPQGRQHWPEGPDCGIAVHPDCHRTANLVYGAFVRLFGHSKERKTARDAKIEAALSQWDEQGYTVIPPSGKLRDLTRLLPHILDRLGCQILHLLPINPTPTTYARFGRFGSPYALQDLTAVDPALVEFDRQSTGVDQFYELSYAVHQRGARLFLDLVTNHTGWGSTLQENHPEWFAREPDGTFISPGAWGVNWEDLVEFRHNQDPGLWEQLAEAFLTWCRRGVDGFRCDAGYKVPLSVWQFITARVHQEFPETIFFLEGLGGDWNDTETLLTEGGMHWAYSELFQNYSGSEIAHYLDHAHTQSKSAGILLHYSETHDNPRLAGQGRDWALMRNRLCALTSVSGSFGFTAGVEWLAAEKINVHELTGLAWDNPNNLIEELTRLNRLLADHPCFFDGASLTRLSPVDSPVYALQRDSADGKDRVLVLINTDIHQAHAFTMPESSYRRLGAPKIDLLGQTAPRGEPSGSSRVQFKLEPGGCYCLAQTETPRGLSGNAYRQARAQAAWGIAAVSRQIPMEEIGPFDWRQLAEWVAADPNQFLAVIPHLDRHLVRTDLVKALQNTQGKSIYPQVVSWGWEDHRRVTLVPPDHWLLVHDVVPFRATLNTGDDQLEQHIHSLAVPQGYIACFEPRPTTGEAQLQLERYGAEPSRARAQVRFVGAHPQFQAAAAKQGMTLLTNGLGGMARMNVDLGRIKSKYDCALGANLNPSFPVDRHIFVKRIRAWVNADGFISPLNRDSMVDFEAGPPSQWQFVANAGDGRSVEVHLAADMLDHRNTTLFHIKRPDSPPPFGSPLSPECEVRLTVRVDIEDRNFHTETDYNEENARHFPAHCKPLTGRPGFEFSPAEDRHLRVYTDHGSYHHETEWSRHVPHPVEQSRGHAESGDAYSPGWFDLPLAPGEEVLLTLCADSDLPSDEEEQQFIERRRRANQLAMNWSGLTEQDPFGRQLSLALSAYVVRRNQGRTVIAGYPWFLDWGRDSLICARGMLTAGRVEEVRQLLAVFGHFVQDGTLPNTIHGDHIANRNTSDAPLWLGIVCKETAALVGDTSLYSTSVNPPKRTLADVLREIAVGYCQGTPNGIRMDPASGLIWSPSHFTWMDTNYPAGTPREGYPIEIQVLWIRLMRQLERLQLEPITEPWSELAARAEASLQRYYWLEDRGYFADLLIAAAGQPAASAISDNALRSNYLLAISLGLVSGERAQRCVHAAIRHLVVPGALRSLAPMAVSPPLPIRGNHGQLLNDPEHPYWGRYEGDEDTRRKPAYHNGSGWTWTFPAFCEALVHAYDFSPEAVAAARAYLGSMDRLLIEGCLGHIPELVDGDAPHQQRGCDAQAWGTSEALRVWKLLETHSPANPRSS